MELEMKHKKMQKMKLLIMVFKILNTDKIINIKIKIYTT